MLERTLYPIEGDPARAPAAWRPSDPRQLTEAGIHWLDPRRLAEAPALTEEARSALEAGRLTAVHVRRPRWGRAVFAEKAQRGVSPQFLRKNAKFSC